MWSIVLFFFLPHFLLKSVPAWWAGELCCEPFRAGTWLCLQDGWEVLHAKQGSHCMWNVFSLSTEFIFLKLVDVSWLCASYYRVGLNDDLTLAPLQKDLCLFLFLFLFSFANASPLHLASMFVYCLILKLALFGEWLLDWVWLSQDVLQVLHICGYMSATVSLLLITNLCFYMAHKLKNGNPSLSGRFLNHMWGIFSSLCFLGELPVQIVFSCWFVGAVRIADVKPFSLYMWGFLLVLKLVYGVFECCHICWSFVESKFWVMLRILHSWKVFLELNSLTCFDLYKENGFHALGRVPRRQQHFLPPFSSFHQLLQRHHFNPLHVPRLN